MWASISIELDFIPAVYDVERKKKVNNYLVSKKKNASKCTFHATVELSTSAISFLIHFCCTKLSILL